MQGTEREARVAGLSQGRSQSETRTSCGRSGVPGLCVGEGRSVVSALRRHSLVVSRVEVRGFDLGFQKLTLPAVWRGQCGQERGQGG